MLTEGLLVRISAGEPNIRSHSLVSCRLEVIQGLQILFRVLAAPHVPYSMPGFPMALVLPRSSRRAVSAARP